MTKHEFVLQGKKMTNKSNFYNHVEEVLTSNQGYKIGRNLDAFNDVLWGGFGDFDYGESIVVVWDSFEFSKRTLNPIFFNSILEILEINENVTLVLN